jgi:membrane protease YdiL (CAAX protease family)
MGQGFVGGLILGAVYERTGRNLVASVLVHSLINALPAMTMIKFGGG